MKSLSFSKVIAFFLVILSIFLLSTSQTVTAMTISYDEAVDGDLPWPTWPRSETFWIGDLDIGMNTIEGTLSRSNGTTDDVWDAFRVTLPCGLSIDDVELSIFNFSGHGGEFDYHQIGTSTIYAHSFNGAETYTLPNIFPTDVATDYQFDIFPAFTSAFDWKVEVHVSSSGDSDCDGIVDADDQCPDTGPGEVVNADGCSIADLCPCDNNWKNHGAYVKCVAHASEEFVDAGLITEEEKDTVVSGAAKSDCGHKK